MQENFKDNKPPKQVLVVRKDLNMRKGKIAAQCAHASMKVLLDKANIFCNEINIDIDDVTFEWLNGIFTKVCVYVNSEEELVEVYEKAKQKGLNCALIEDSGLTEFGGVKTKTVVGVGPAYPEDFIGITDHLKLL